MCDTEAKERSDLLHRNHYRKCGLSLQDNENELTHLETSTLSPIPKALAVVCSEGPSGGASLFLFSAFIYGFSCFTASVFHLFPVSSLPLNHSPGFVPFCIFPSDLSDMWYQTQLTGSIEVVTLTAKAGAQSQPVCSVRYQRWVQPPEYEHLDVTQTK